MHLTFNNLSFTLYIWLIPWLGTSQVAQWQRICLTMQETWVRSLGQEDPLEEERATHCSMLAWKIPWTEEPGGLQCMRSGSVWHDCVTERACTPWLGQKSLSFLKTQVPLRIWWKFLSPIFPPIDLEIWIFNNNLFIKASLEAYVMPWG